MKSKSLRIFGLVNVWLTGDKYNLARRVRDYERTKNKNKQNKKKTQKQSGVRNRFEIRCCPHTLGFIARACIIIRFGNNVKSKQTVADGLG